MSDKKLSIITICYNESNLERTCKSIINQSWQDFEWVVIDGGSSEETQKIWDKYKYRIDKFISEPDTGIYNAMNKGIALSVGEYLQFLNAGDEFYYNNALSNVFKNINRSEDVLYGLVYFKHNEKKFNSIPVIDEIVTKKLLYKDTILHPASFIKRELFEKYGLYNENYKIVSDYEKWFVFLNNNVRFQYIPYIVATFYANGISSTTTLAIEERQQVIQQYFTQEEIDEIERELHPNIPEPDIVTYTNPFEYIFSVKNTTQRTHKVLTILGLKIKFRKKSI